MLDTRKGIGYINIIVSIILAIMLSTLTYQGLSKILVIQKENNLKRDYDIAIQNTIVETYNKSWQDLKEETISIQYNDSTVKIEYMYSEGDKAKGVTDKLTINFLPEDSRLHNKSYNLEKFPET